MWEWSGRCSLATELSRTTQWYFPGLHTLEVLETIITA